MKIRTAKNIALLMGLGIGSMSLVNAAECDSVGAQVTKAITAAPQKVLVVVDEMISKNEACSCEIVKAAIIASSADKALVREIVVTAVTAAQGMAATIAECAVAQAPEAAAEIKAGLSEVFAGAKGGAYSAKGAKMVVEDVVEDFAPEPIVISGVYLVAPVGGGGGFFDEDAAQRAEEALDRAQRLIDILQREMRRRPDSGTDTSGPDPSPTDPA